MTRPLNNSKWAVFLSYASQHCEAAARICRVLRAADIEVWFNQSGCFLEAALFTGGTPTMRINREEIFGPVAYVAL